MTKVVVEGRSDEELAKAVVLHCGGGEVRVYAAGGKANLDAGIAKYYRASQHAGGVPWIVFRDSDTRCPVELRDRLFNGIPPDARRFSLRIVHPMSEAWLLADHEGFSAFFHVAASRLPHHPDDLPDAKRALLDVCGRSRSRRVKEDVVRGPGETGPLYVGT